MKGESRLEAEFARQLKGLEGTGHELPEPEREFRFCDQRRWRADFAWPDQRLLVEIEGGTWGGGRHVRGQGFEDDLEKYNAAMLLGWDVARFSGAMVKSGQAIKTVLVFFGQQKEEKE
jgi:very-short-patch-repair endonuclease